MRINKNIVAKSKLLLNPLFPTLKKGIIQLFIVSLPKVPEFWCYFFLKHKITNFRELLFYYRKKFKQLQYKKKKIEKKILTDILSEELLKVIEEDRFGRGRESFVMLLHYFKNNPNIETCLATLLDDEQLYAFAIDELTILKNFNYVDKVQKILSKEKVPWRRKVAERYIKKYLDSVF